MELEFLTKFGMTPLEAKIYKELLLLKESQIGPIIERTKIHRGTVYNSLQKLIDKGFISYTLKDGKGTYRITDLTIFSRLIYDEQEKLNELSKKIKEIKETSQIFEFFEKPNIEVLTGDEAFKSFFRDLYEYSYRTKKEYLFMGRGGMMIKHFGEEYYMQTQELKRNLKLKCRVLLSKVSESEPINKIVEGNIKYINWKKSSQTSTWIYGSNVVIVIWSSNPIKIVKITSKDVRDSYTSFFEEMWAK